jgi:diketogulonate reductase-like aldo/keto reductase
MEKLLSTGKVRSIGVSNFNIPKLEKLLAGCSVVPVVNQIEAHPYLQQPSLAQFCKDKNILIEAYSPLGNNQTGEPRTVDDPLVKELSEKTGMDGGQLLASWGIQRGTVVLPKSVTPHRIEGNLKVSELSDDVFAAMNGLERHKRFNYNPRWGFDMFDEVGEAEARRTAKESGPENLTKFTV